MHVAQIFFFAALAGYTLAAPRGNGQRPLPNGSNSQPATTTTANAAFIVGYTRLVPIGDTNMFKPSEIPSTTGSPTLNPLLTSALSSPLTDTSSSRTVQSLATPTPAPMSGSNAGYMSVVSEWRSKMGMSALTEDTTLAANALKTAVDGNGQMVHELNPGSMAQVLAPGDISDFEKCFVGGWLCEVPSLPGLDGICATMSQGWAYNGETGHADILSSTSYSKIGCGNANGIWACDLA